MGLFDQIKDYIAQRTPTSMDLAQALKNSGQVINQGLLNPNPYNAPAAEDFKNSALGLLGGVPGLGDAMSGMQAWQDMKHGQYGSAALNSIGLLPFVPGMAGVVKKIPKLAYQIEHKPMSKAGGASTLDDLTSSFGEDIYGPNALQYFGSGNAAEKKIVAMMRALRGKPDEMVTVYRGVPPGVEKINPGDWVTLDRNVASYYATPESYGEAGKGIGKVLEMKVPARHITSWPDSLIEFGYFPE